MRTEIPAAPDLHVRSFARAFFLSGYVTVVNVTGGGGSAADAARSRASRANRARIRIDGTNTAPAGAT
jgi:hypothetical protein